MEAEIFEKMSQHPLIKLGENQKLEARLVRDGQVELRTKSGEPIAVMPRYIYDELQILEKTSGH